MTAPVCPISHGQDPSFRKGNYSAGPTSPTAPLAYDLPSLINAVNMLREALRTFTGQRTVNNISTSTKYSYKYKKKGDKYYSQYPEWVQVGKQVAIGFVYHKDKKLEGGMDRFQRAYVVRINSVTFQNRTQEDPNFKCSYTKKLDG